MSECKHPKAYAAICADCGNPRTVCDDCLTDVAPSGVDGGSWVPFSHTCGLTRRVMETCPICDGIGKVPVLR